MHTGFTPEHYDLMPAMLTKEKGGKIQLGVNLLNLPKVSHYSPQYDTNAILATLLIQMYNIYCYPFGQTGVNLLILSDTYHLTDILPTVPTMH